MNRSSHVPLLQTLGVVLLVLLAVIMPVRAQPDFVLQTDIPLPTDTLHSFNTNVTVTGVYGFTGTVDLAETHSSGLACGSIDPPSITGSGIAILSCHAPTPGLYNVTVTGDSGSLHHKTSYTANITAAPPSTPPPATILGLSPPLFYSAIGTIIVVMVLAVILGFRRRRAEPSP